MMALENQNLEWKRQWKDDFMKSVCGLANAGGGTLEIGRDDNGAIIGVDNARELLEELPNSIRMTMGIVPSIESRTDSGKQYIVITVDSSGTAVSFRGKYYLRSGSTTQELNGAELQNFILRKQGKTWDSLTIPNVNFKDLDTASFRKFREKALASERLKKIDLDISDEALLDSLMLIENGKLTRAAVLLFHETPERFVFGSYVKVGFFANNADLLYQDEFHGSLITMPDRIMETIFHKYFKGLISYDGLQRIESYPIPRPALREAILNAIVHRDYTTGVPIQIKIFPDKVIIYNDGRLPDNWTVENLFAIHRSRPYNPKIANTFFRAGFIEAWGRGIERIAIACEEAGKPAPQFEVLGDEIRTIFNIETADRELVGGVGSRVGSRVGSGVGSELSDNQRQILDNITKNPHISATELAKIIGISKRKIEANISKLKNKGLIERIGNTSRGQWVVKSS